MTARRLLLLALLPLATAPPASAGEAVAVHHQRYDLLRAPALAGDRVAWVQGLVSLNLRTAPVGGGRVARVARLEGEWPSALSVAGGPGRVAVAYEDASPPGRFGGQDHRWSRLLAGPSAGPLGIEGGTPEGEEPSPGDPPAAADRVYAADLAGDALVSVRSAPGGVRGRSDRPARIAVRDLAAGTPERDVVPPSNATLLPAVRAAGPYVAYGIRAGEGATLVVADRATRAEITRLAFEPAPYDWAVQADGTLAVAEGDGEAVRIGWARPGETALRPLVERAVPLGMELAGDRVAYVRETGSAGASEVALTGLDGATVAASFPLASATGLAFDGTRVAFTSVDCVYTAPADGVAAGASPPAGPCPRALATTDVPRGRVPVRRLRRVALDVACPMAGDRGCRGVLTLRFGRRATRTLGRRGFTVPRGERRQVVVRADRQKLRRLRRGPTRRVFVGVRVRDEAGRLGEAGDEINLARR